MARRQINGNSNIIKGTTMNWLIANHIHELLHMAAATFFIITGLFALWEYHNLRSGFVLNFSVMCLFSAGYALHVVISHNLPKFGEFWIPWTDVVLVITFTSAFLYLLTMGQFLGIRSRLFAIPLVLLGIITVVALGDFLLYQVYHRSFIFTSVPRIGIAPHQLALGEGAYSLQIMAEILPIIFIVSFVWGVVYLLIHQIRSRSTDILMYIGLFMTAAIIVNENLVALSVYEGLYLLAFTKAFEALRILRDINLRSRSQFERRLHDVEKGELEQRVVERTSQLEAANKELEAFSYSVSHDLRAPLRGIDGFSQILLEDYQEQIDEQGKNYLQRIRLGTQRMAQLIDDILNLSRISRSEMNIRQVNLSEIVKEIAENFQEAQPERHVEFIIREGIKVQADSHLLRIVLENLVGNAWKYTSKHPSAHIEFGIQQQNENTVYFVRDDGAGFDMNNVEKLFGAFQRLHTTDEFPGTGVGLATVQRIIRRHGGTVWAEGVVEKGATFYFTL